MATEGGRVILTDAEHPLLNGFQDKILKAL
jgi:hypothetical protein